MTYQSLLFVFVGGGAGSVFRFLLNRVSLQWTTTSVWGTLSANIIASALFGLVMGLIYSKVELSDQFKFLLLTGICGGLSTFSTFNFELYEFIKNQQLLLAFVYIFCSIAASLGAMSLLIAVVNRS